MHLWWSWGGVLFLKKADPPSVLGTAVCWTTRALLCYIGQPVVQGWGGSVHDVCALHTLSEPSALNQFAAFSALLRWSNGILIGRSDEALGEQTVNLGFVVLASSLCTCYRMCD